MKVLLLTPNFWTSGTVTFIRELQAGWPQEWPRPVIATVTKSGKRSSKWGRTVQQLQRADSTPWEPDICDTRERIIEYATEFDLVHVNEVETRASEQDYWYELLERLRTPFSVQLHGNLYSNVRWQRVLEAKSFTNIVWQTPGNVPTALIRRGVLLVPLPRPWNMKPFTDDVEADNVIGFTGRLTPDKGAAHVASLVKHARMNVCMHGASVGGGYPYGYGLQKHLFGEIKIKRAESPWTWSDGEHELHYAGPYADGVVVSQHHRVHVSATRSGFSGGTEYTVLEAINAGCRIVQPNHMIEPNSGLISWTYEWEHRGLVGAFKNPIPSLVDAVHAATAAEHNPRYNRAVIEVRHNPQTLARAFFGVAMSSRLMEGT